MSSVWVQLFVGTEKRGVDLPHVSEDYETNVPGIYIAGELGGMGLIKNSVEQGRTAIENMVFHKVVVGRRFDGNIASKFLLPVFQDVTRPRHKTFRLLATAR